MAQVRGTPSDSQATIYPMRLERVDYGESRDVWITGNSLYGMITRWHKGQSLYVPPSEHCTDDPENPQVWKGYLAAVLWHKDLKKWIPGCLEVSERLELDLRGKWIRGQIWRLSRAKKEGKRKPPCRGTLLETRSDQETPVATCILKKIEDIYRVKGMVLSTPSPLSDLTMVTPIAARAPGQPIDEGVSMFAPENTAEPEGLENRRQDLKRLMAGFGKPLERNGRSS